MTTTISGWGNYPRQESQCMTPSTVALLRAAVNQEGSFLARGRGRSYGDSANAHKVLATSYCNHFIDLTSVLEKLQLSRALH